MKLEEQLLPHKKLAPAYDQVVWLYVYRTFEGDEDDRLAERISLRFGVTSWPQLFLADPATMKILAHTGRSVESFLAAVGRTKVETQRYAGPHETLAAAEQRAIALEEKPSTAAAKAGLDDEDPVVRIRALQFLAAQDPDVIVKRAKTLLAIPSDPLRYEVCAVLAKAADPEAADALEALVEEPKDSLNPNVLRIRAVQALAACGDLVSVEVIAPFAQGACNNGLTGIAVDTLATLAKRHKKARKRVAAILKDAYPEPPEDERMRRMCVALAKRIHKARGAKSKFPKVYDRKAWETLRGGP